MTSGLYYILNIAYDSMCVVALCVVSVLLSLLSVNVGGAANCGIPHCAQCNGISPCNACNDGYYLEYGYCTSCPTNCLICTGASQCQTCVSSYWNPGGKCNNPCTDCSSSGCEDTDGRCYECIAGRYGTTCDRDCSLCRNGECDQLQCTKGCKDGYVQYNSGSGYSDCHPCTANCTQCSNTTFCTQCEQGFYSYYTRIETGRGRRQCSQCQGYCTQCTSIDQCPGWCNTECIKQGCDVSGSCVTKPSTPRTSNNEIPTPTNAIEHTLETQAATPQDNNTYSTASTKGNEETVTDKGGKKADDNSVVILGAAAGGGAFLVIVVVLIICFIKRRSNKSAENQVDGNADDQVNVEADYPVYAKPNKPSRTSEEPTQDYLYAVPNKPNRNNNEASLYAIPNKAKKPSRHTKSEIQEPRRIAYSNVMVDLDMERVQETNVDEIQLEDVEQDRLTNDIDMGANIPTSDTYYNMEGLIRSQVKVTQLLEYVKKKTNFESEFKKLLKGLQRSCDEALKPDNRKKNRYNGIYAYDATRAVLHSGSYINANYIDGHNQPRAYIASLGPTADTMNKYATFWEMVWQDDVEAIVMLTNLREGEKMKCEQYWPEQGMVLACGKYNIHCVAEKKFAEFVVREFVLQNNDFSDKHNVVQYHYTAWPDRSVPDSVVSLVAFRDKVEQQQRKTTSPMIVHCSAGIGRTGTYIALDILTKQGRDEEYVDLFGCAIGLRGQRVNMIQNETQYEYLHQCVLYVLTCGTEPIRETSIHRLVTEERIAAQYKAMTALDSVIGRDSPRSTGHRDRKENRTGSDIADDRYCVQLTSSNNGYINAVYINGYVRQNQFIAAQTPMPSTLQAFISMVYHEKVQCIVSLDDENTSDKTIGHYLPHDNKVCTFGKYTLLCTGSNNTEAYIVRDLKLSLAGTPSFEDLTIRHVQFHGWKSKDVVPHDHKAFLKLIVEVNKNLDKRKSDCPVLIHCLTGAERTGIFCAVSTMLELLVIDKQLTGIHAISHIRDRRHLAIHKQEMFKFCYDCVKMMIDLSDKDPYYNLVSLRQ